MVDDNGKVSDPQRKMDENPEKSRAAFEATKKESLKVSSA